jgi:prevent-host-death family protein
VREVGAFEAKNALSALLDLVEEGQEIVITRHGKPVARLVRETGRAEARLRARQAAKELARLSRAMKLDGLSLKALIDEGRP